MDTIESIFHTFRQVIVGRQLISHEIKYRTFCLVCAFVHLVFCIVMGIIGAYILFIYNILVVYGYVFLGIVMSHKGKYSQILFLVFLEIEIHSALATLLLGADWKYMLYTVALVPAAFFFVSSIPDRTKHAPYALGLSAFVIAVYFTIMFIEPRIIPYYDNLEFPSIRTGMVYFNSVIAFSCQLVLAYLFAMEARYMEMLLLTENIKLGEEASYDPLTKLMNRRSLNKALTQAMEEDPDLVYSVLMLDIDDFKSVNDSFGHFMGDNVLLTISNLVKNELRSDDYSCRWGGEEFLLVVRGNTEETINTAERIRQLVSETEMTDKRGRKCYVTVTIGLADNRSGKNLRAVIEDADDRLYKGKKQGKNLVIV